MQGARGEVECTGVDADLAALARRGRGELREADVVADAEADASEL